MDSFSSLSSILLLVLAFVSCREIDKGASFNKDEIQSEIREVLENYFRDIGDLGLTSEFKYLDNSDDFFWVPPGYQSAISFDSVETVIVRTAPQFRSITYRWQELRINPLSSKIANYTGIVEGILIDTANVTSEVKMIETGTMIRRVSGWKILSGQSRVWNE